ncbi:pyridoxamine 5'-phosphate oxidase family protein [Mesorhizobium sp. A556]
MNVTDMTREESIDVLSVNRLGRLACARENQPYVVPFHYAFSDNHLYSFSLMGQKVEWMRQNDQVCVQVDEMESARKWQSVVVFGAYEELPATPQWERERGHACHSCSNTQTGGNQGISSRPHKPPLALRHTCFTG